MLTGVSLESCNRNQSNSSNPTIQETVGSHAADLHVGDADARDITAFLYTRAK